MGGGERGVSQGIPDFLRTRYAEERAEAAKQPDGDDYPLSPWEIRWEETGDWNGYSYLRITKARLLADLDAKERIIEDTWGGPDHEEMWAHHLRLLALPYADHPDYRKEWRP
jgi:hypothetical protein